MGISICISIRYRSCSHAFQLGESSQQLLVIQCLSGNDSGGLLACAKYKIQEKLRQQPDASVFVLVLITLHRGSAAKNFIGEHLIIDALQYSDFRANFHSRLASGASGVVPHR